MFYRWRDVSRVGAAQGYVSGIYISLVPCNDQPSSRRVLTLPRTRRHRRTGRAVELTVLSCLVSFSLLYMCAHDYLLCRLSCVSRVLRTTLTPASGVKNSSDTPSGSSTHGLS